MSYKKISLLAVVCALSGCATNQATEKPGEQVTVNNPIVETDLTVKPFKPAKVATASSKPAQSVVVKNEVNQPADTVKSKKSVIVAKTEKQLTKPVVKPVKIATASSKPAKPAVTKAMVEQAVEEVKPVGAEKVVSTADKKPAVKKPVEKPFELYKGETYKAALVRYLRSKGYKGVAWAVVSDTKAVLEQVISENQSLSGDIAAQLSDQLSVSFKISTDDKIKYAAIHDWQDYKVKIMEVHGDTLKQVMNNLVTDFGWNWDAKKSWRSKKSLHGFAIPFPVVAPAHDIGFVLNQVLKDRPVRAEFHDDTQTVFITDDN